MTGVISTGLMKKLILRLVQIVPVSSFLLTFGYHSTFFGQHHTHFRRKNRDFQEIFGYEITLAS
jgi:hypothetical protein